MGGASVRGTAVLWTSMAIASLAIAGPDSDMVHSVTTESVAVTYDLTPESRLDVLTRPGGLFGSFGQGHRVRARTFSGTIVFDPANPAGSSVEITVQTDDLDVMPMGKDRDDAPKVEASMREHVLHPERYPTIAFRSRSVTPIEGGVRVAGDLTLVGTTRPVTVDMRVQASARRILAEGRFSIKQSDWGIEPYSAALGAIKVADRVTFDLRAIGIAR